MHRETSSSLSLEREVEHSVTQLAAIKTQQGGQILACLRWTGGLGHQPPVGVCIFCPQRPEAGVAASLGRQTNSTSALRRYSSTPTMHTVASVIEHSTPVRIFPSSGSQGWNLHVGGHTSLWAGLNGRWTRRSPGTASVRCPNSDFASQPQSHRFTSLAMSLAHMSPFSSISGSSDAETSRRSSLSCRLHLDPCRPHAIMQPSSPPAKLASPGMSPANGSYSSGRTRALRHISPCRSAIGGMFHVPISVKRPTGLILAI